MQCNIDAKGKALRLIYGLIMLAVAAVVAVLMLAGVLGLGIWGWAIVTALALFGGFGIFEARAGWCVVRAMGFKTPY
ncbi:MAG: hypothetical protein AAGB26_15815 [Planctomycetota bacterium]